MSNPHFPLRTNRYTLNLPTNQYSLVNGKPTVGLTSSVLQNISFPLKGTPHIKMIWETFYSNYEKQHDLYAVPPWSTAGVAESDILETRIYNGRIPSSCPDLIEYYSPKTSAPKLYPGLYPGHNIIPPGNKVGYFKVINWTNHPSLSIPILSTCERYASTSEDSNRGVFLISRLFCNVTNIAFNPDALPRIPIPDGRLTDLRFLDSRGDPIPIIYYMSNGVIPSMGDPGLKSLISKSSNMSTKGWEILRSRNIKPTSLKRTIMVPLFLVVLLLPMIGIWIRYKRQLNSKTKLL
jgi:hypothetical protein